MPIYGVFGTFNAPYTIAKNITVKDYYKLKEIFREAKKSFTYRKSELFVNSIDTQIKNDSIIARFDSSKTGIDIGNFQNMLESLINEANLILSKYKKMNKYKFDIAGNWNVGYVVIMEKK